MHDGAELSLPRVSLLACRLACRSQVLASRSAKRDLGFALDDRLGLIFLLLLSAEAPRTAIRLVYPDFGGRRSQEPCRRATHTYMSVRSKPTRRLCVVLLSFIYYHVVTAARGYTPTLAQSSARASRYQHHYRLNRFSSPRRSPLTSGIMIGDLSWPSRLQRQPSQTRLSMVIPGNLPPLIRRFP